MRTIVALQTLYVGHAESQLVQSIPFLVAQLANANHQAFDAILAVFVADCLQSCCFHNFCLNLAHVVNLQLSGL